MLTLVRPSAAHLPAYAAALARGWSPDTMRPEVAQEQLARIAEDAPGFLASLEDEDPQGATVTLPDGSRVPRLPWLVRWMWDGGFAGSINLRWPPAGAPMPPHVLGHIGFSVVPWKRRLGHATRALALILPEARARGLAFVELTTEPGNTASQRTIEKNGGRLVERFQKAPAYGGGPSLRYRIDL
jgi:predicted acetyltransferase